MAISRFTTAILLTLGASCVWQTYGWVLDSVSYIDEKKCGSTDDLAHRIEVCAKPMMDMIQGTIDPWPKDTKGVRDLCTSFGSSEKCIRENARKCAHGLHKTIISTVATSVARARKRECQDPKLNDILKATQCFERNQPVVHKIMSNITSHLSVIEKDFKDLDAKTNAVCCMVNDIERNLARPLALICPEETKLIIRVVRTVLEDALDLICRQPKCLGVFKGYKVQHHQTDRFNGLVETILRIVFTLG